MGRKSKELISLKQQIFYQICFFFLKEMFNLQRLQRVGIPCPTPVLLKKHVLFLSFIGKDTVPAQRLRDVMLTSEELANAYKQCLNVRISRKIDLNHNSLSLFYSYSNEFIMNVN